MKKALVYIKRKRAYTSKCIALFPLTSLLYRKIVNSARKS